MRSFTFDEVQNILRALADRIGKEREELETEREEWIRAGVKGQADRCGGRILESYIAERFALEAANELYKEV